MKRIITASLTLCIGVLIAEAQTTAAQGIVEKDTTFVTYPFDDPDPVVADAKIYPYFRYDGYSGTSVQKQWKMVVLENDFLRIRILPEIGGKIWSVVDKKSGNEMFYDNKVVKFRDISLRGPWTSGGIEFNFGIIGHAPTCSAPVDYKTVQKEDGVSCYISSFELLTRTRWTVEVFLPKDMGFFRTTTTWSNISSLYQPYYTWTNTAETATEDLEIIYPATYTIEHNGTISDFPYDRKEKRELAMYSQLDFGSDKSFHPSGSQRGYFGAYWHDHDFGIMHCASRDDKAGRKYWAWAKSEQGDIWRELLTDTQPQYVELQSGRLFNQNLLESVETPYKAILFDPYGVDIFNEYWYPFSGIGKAEDFSVMGAAKVDFADTGLNLVLYPVTSVSGKLLVLDERGSVLVSRNVDVRASEIFEVSLVLKNGERPGRITLAGCEIWNASDKTIDRPNAIPVDYSENSASYHMEHAQYYAGMRRYALAEESADKAVEADSYYADALVLKAELLYRKGDWAGAYDCCNRVLSINEYNAKANYISGLAAKQMGKTYDALDRFEIAAVTTALRSAACTELCRLHLELGDCSLASEYASKAVRANGANMTAMALGAVAASISGSPDAGRWLEDIEALDPLTHLPSFIGFVEGRVTKEELVVSVREEYAYHEYIEAALLYASAGRKADAAKLTDAAERNVLTALWSAYLKDDATLIRQAEEMELDFVSPFRQESLAMLQWAVDNGGSWKSSYLLAKLYSHLGLKDKAIEAMAGNDCSYAPFYAMRYDLAGSKDDIERAISLDPEQWRYQDRLAKLYIAEGNDAVAMALLAPYYKRHPDNFRIGDTFLQAVIKSGKYAEAEKILAKMNILPFEGQAGSHVMYRDVKLHLAAQAIDSRRLSTAIKKIDEARQWPHSLGVGKPYDDMIDSSLEDWMMAVAYARMGKKSKADEYLKRIKDDDGSWGESFSKAASGKARVSDIIGNLDSTLDKRLF